jgi:hypothetical protein
LYLMAPPRGSPKPPGSGRKKGSKNKLSARSVKQLAEELVQQKRLSAQRQLDEAISHPLTPLQFCLEAMRDPSNPPGFRLECAKASMAYVHAKKAEEPGDKPAQVTEIVRLIVQDPRTCPDTHPDVRRDMIQDGAARGVPIPEPDELGLVERAAPHAAPALDPLTVARSRLDKMRGIN